MTLGESKYFQEMIQKIVSRDDLIKIVKLLLFKAHHLKKNDQSWEKISAVYMYLIKDLCPEYKKNS